MATASELLSHDWYYQIEGTNILLYTRTDDTSGYVAPDIAVDNGLKIEYITGSNVFVDSSGDSDNTSPDEDSILNCTDNVAKAIIYYVKARLAEDKENTQMAEYYFNKWGEKLNEAMDAKIPGPRAIMPVYPYAIR